MPPDNDPYKPPYFLDTWRGKQLTELSKEKLVVALQRCWQLYQQTIQENTALIGYSLPKLPWWQRLF